jgi:predicted secreted protein
MKPMRTIALAVLLMGSALPALAAEPSTQLELSTSTQREVANDQVDATLYVQDRQSQPATLANRLNHTITQAMASARAYPDVVASTGSYSSWPDYAKNGGIQGWQGRAEIRLKSRNFVQCAQLVAQLQKTMLLQGVDFSVSPETRKKVEQQLLPEAIEQLQSTARVAAKALGKTRVTVKTLQVGSSNNAPRPVMALMAKRANSVDTETVAAPDWQAGQSVLQMQVGGTLELN